VRGPKKAGGARPWGQTAPKSPNLQVLGAKGGKGGEVREKKLRTNTKATIPANYRSWKREGNGAVKRIDGKGGSGIGRTITKDERKLAATKRELNEISFA